MLISLAILQLLALACPIPDREQPPEIRALPPWPSDSKVAKALDEQFVFRDPETGGIVVAHSPSTTNNASEGDVISIRREYFRFYLANRVAPVIRTSVTESSEKEFLYEYEVVNCPQAQSPIFSWWIARTPDNNVDRAFRGSHPSWRMTRAAAAQVLLRDRRMSPFVAWGKWDSPINPGEKVSGFQIVSVFRPGFTTSYATGDGVIRVPGSVYDERMEEQLLPLQQNDVKLKTTLAIGPRFSPETSNLEVARMYIQETQELIESKWLDVQSPFIAEILIRLRSYIDSGGSAPPSFTVEPQPGFETEIANAIRLSLQGGSTP